MPQARTRPADATREQLLDAAEKLFLEQGLDEVSLRAILREAGQRNQSALQYHFGNRAGLIAAILRRRLLQLEGHRQALVDAALGETPRPDLHGACTLLIGAPFLLCREDRGFREFLGRFGQHLLASDQDIVAAIDEQNLPSLTRLRGFVRDALGPVDPELLALRLENAWGLTLLAISRRARRGERFSGRSAELFLDNLVDQVAAMLAAPVSDTTRARIDDATP